MLASADNPLGAIPGFNHPKEDFQTVRDVSVIFPAFNEEGNIRCTVETVIRGRPQGAGEKEKIVVGGGCKEGSALGCGEVGDQFPQNEINWYVENTGEKARPIKEGKLTK